MAIVATYKDNDHSIENAYIKVERIWGSKAEGWNCWVGVYLAEGAEEKAVPFFSVNAPYVDGQNPFEALYKAIEESAFVITSEKMKKLEAEANAARTAIAAEEDEKVEVAKPKKKASKKAA